MVVGGSSSVTLRVLLRLLFFTSHSSALLLSVAKLELDLRIAALTIAIVAMSSLWAQFWAARHPPADPVHISSKDKAVLVTGTCSGQRLITLVSTSCRVDADGAQVQILAWAMKPL